MIDNYELIEPGHWFQSKPTGEIMKYDTNYMQYYTKMDFSMSKLRFDLLSKYVKFIGSEEHIVDFMKILDILVLPSINSEDFPNVILEAMALKKPVIASNIAGTKEQILHNKTGLLVKPADFRSLSKAMQLFIEKKIQQKLVAIPAITLVLINWYWNIHKGL
jgi:glycosyltransferase involved in cell wall biosynthesis